MQNSDGAVGTVAGFWYESADTVGFVGKLAVYTKAARHGGTGGRISRRDATPARQAYLERSEESSRGRKLHQFVFVASNDAKRL